MTTQDRTAHPAYRCGQLLAELANLQETALPNLTTTLVDKYFGMAAVRPGVILPRLVRESRAHHKILRRDNPAAQHAIEERIQTAMCGLEMPRTFTTVEQGLFEVGFYEAQAQQWRQRAAHAARKKQRSIDDTDSPTPQATDD